MDFELHALLSLSIGIAPVIGWVRFHKTDPAFLPFIILLTAGFINEVLSIALMKRGYTTIVTFNVFKLIETFLLLWQFYNWGLFGRNRRLYLLLQLFFVLCWLAEDRMFGSIQYFNSYFVMAYSFLLVMMSIRLINRILVSESIPLYRQPVFLICIGLIAFFTCATLIESFWIFGLTESRMFRLKIYEIMSYINLFTNILFAFAFLWIPMRPRYILRC